MCHNEKLKYLKYLNLNEVRLQNFQHYVIPHRADLKEGSIITEKITP